MELIERYIYAVGKRLPKKQRADIEKELRSLIMDELEGRAGGAEPGSDEITAVLKEMGSPAEVAARYNEKGRYLIGPALYPLYTMVAGIMAGAVLLGLTISMIVELLQSQPNAAEVMKRVAMLIPQFMVAAASGLGFMTIAFGIAERLLSDRQIKSLQDQETWDPSQLPSVPDKHDVMKPGEEILGILLSVAAIVIFNAFPKVVGIYCVQEGTCLPVLSQQALQYYLPFWNVVWVLSVGKSVLLLARGRWELGTHIYDIVLSVLNIAVLAVMITGPRLLNEAAIAILRNATSVNIPVIVRYSILLALGIAIIVTAVETGIKIYRLIRDRAQSA